MKEMSLKNRKDALEGALKRVGMACVFMLGIILCMASCDKDDGLEGKSGTLQYGGQSYTVRIGSINKSDNGNIYIVLLGDIPPLLIIKNGTVSPVFGMRIVADKKTYEYTSFGFENGGIYYTFSTKQNPDKITVYNSDGSGSSVTL